MGKTYSTKGLDGEDHAITCEFITNDAILPCSCDATRNKGSWWYRSWHRWLVCNVIRGHQGWPVEGPDGDPWVPNFDFEGREL